MDTSTLPHNSNDGTPPAPACALTAEAPSERLPAIDGKGSGVGGRPAPMSWSFDVSGFSSRRPPKRRAAGDLQKQSAVVLDEDVLPSLSSSATTAAAAPQPREDPKSTRNRDDENTTPSGIAGTDRPTKKKVDKYQAALDQNRKIAEALSVVRQSHEEDGDAGSTARALDDSSLTQAVATLNEFNVDPSLALVPQSCLIPHPLSSVVKADIARRNYMNLERWYCLSRPQYSKSCGVSSLTSIWNYLYSTLGPTGTLPPISQEFVMSTILGFQPPFETIRWGPFTGNVSLMKWFYKINAHFGIKKGKAFYMWKKLGSGRTLGLTDAEAETQTKQWLQDPNAAIIYHCKNHYMVPIGYQEQPRAPRLAYAAMPASAQKDASSLVAAASSSATGGTAAGTNSRFADVTQSDFDTILLIGEPSRGIHPPIHCRKFADVATDLGTGAPFIFNIRHPERGAERVGAAKTATGSAGTAAAPPPPPTTSKRFGTSIHCFLGFRNDVESGDVAAALEGSESDDHDDDE